MTRETKVGMVVAGSFLCLVGVVVASKLRGGDPNKDAVAQNSAQKKDDAQAKDGKSKAPGVLPASLVEEQTNPPAAKPKVDNPPAAVPPPAATPPAATNPPPLVSVPNVPNPKNLLDDEEERVRKLLAQNTPKLPTGNNPPAPTKVDPPFRLPDVAQNDTKPTPPKVDSLTIPKEVAPPPVDPKKFDLGLPPAAPPPASPPAVNNNPPKKESTPVNPPPVSPPAVNPPAVNPPAVNPPAANPPAANPPGPDTKLEFPLPPPVNPAAVEKKENVPPPAVPPPVNPPAAKKDLPPTSTVPPVNPPPVAPPSDPGLSIVPRKDIPSRPFDPPAMTTTPPKDVKPLAIGGSNPPAAGNNPPVGSPKDEIRLDPKPFNPAVNDTKPNPPPLGSDRFNSPPLETRPITPPSGNLPRVTSFDVDTYTTRPEDTSFAGVSQRLYGSDKYAAALLQYNREHALARENVRMEPPRLTSGTPLYIPPKEWLQTKYPNLVAGNFNPPPLGANTNPPVLGSPSTPPVRTSAPPVGAFQANPATSDPVKRYVVRGQGQHIIEIAQQTLGDGRRWAEIYRLNPSIQPQQPIPAGTELRLPDTARLQ